MVKIDNGIKMKEGNYELLSQTLTVKAQEIL